MKRLQSFNSAYRLLVVSLSSIMSVFVVEYLNVYLPNRGIAAALTLIIVVAIIMIATSMVEKLIDASPFLRKIILRSDFIEGYWFDLSREEKTGAIVQGVVIKISYEDGELNVNGIGFDEVGNKLASFNSISATYLGKTLYHHYYTQKTHHGLYSETGMGQLMFDQPPVSYTGFWIDFTSGNKNSFDGKKVTREQLKQFNNFATLDDKKNFIVQIIDAEKTKAEVELHT